MPFHTSQFLDITDSVTYKHLNLPKATICYAEIVLPTGSRSWSACMNDVSRRYWARCNSFEPFFLWTIRFAWWGIISTPECRFTMSLSWRILHWTFLSTELTRRWQVPRQLRWTNSLKVRAAVRRSTCAVRTALSWFLLRLSTSIIRHKSHISPSRCCTSWIFYSSDVPAYSATCSAPCCGRQRPRACRRKKCWGAFLHVWSLSFLMGRRSE